MYWKHIDLDTFCRIRLCRYYKFEPTVVFLMELQCCWYYQVMQSQAQLSRQHSHGSLPSSLQNSFPSGVVSGHQPTCLQNSITCRTQLQQKVHHWQRAYTGGGQRHWRLKKKNDRDRSTLTTGYSLRVHNSRRSIPAKSTNQIRVRVAHAHVYRQIPARAPLGSRGI